MMTSTSLSRASFVSWDLTWTAQGTPPGARRCDDRRRRRCTRGVLRVSLKEAVVSRTNGDLRSHFIRRRVHGGRPPPAAIPSHFISLRVRHGRLPPVARLASSSSPRGPLSSSWFTSALLSLPRGGACTRGDDVADGPGPPSDAITMGGERWRPGGSADGEGVGLGE